MLSDVGSGVRPLCESEVHPNCVAQTVIHQLNQPQASEQPGSVNLCAFVEGQNRMHVLHRQAILPSGEDEPPRPSSFFHSSLP